MKKIERLDVVGPHAPSSAKQLSNERLINWYWYDKKGSALFPVPGVEKVGTQSYGLHGRGIFYSQTLDAVIVIYDDFIYQLNKDESLTLLNEGAALKTSIGRVYFAENYISQLAFSDERYFYVYDIEKKTLLTATLPKNTAPGRIDYQDTYFMFNDLSSRNWYISDYNNGLSWDGKNFGSILGKTVGLTAFKSQVVVFGKTQSGVFYDAGVTPFPYKPDTVLRYDYGCVSADSIAKSQGYLMWLGIDADSSPILLLSTGASPIPISTPAINEVLESLVSPEKCDAYMYEHQGHIFYVINFYADNLTLLFDVTTGQFSQLTGPDDAVFPLSGVARLGNTTYAISRDDGYLYKTSTQKYTYDGKALKRTRITKNREYPTAVIVDRIKLYMEQGTQVTSGDINKTQALFSVSHNKGVSFDEQVEAPMAALGERNTEMWFTGFGLSRYWTYKIDVVSEKFASLFMSESGDDVELMYDNL